MEETEQTDVSEVADNQTDDVSTETESQDESNQETQPEEFVIPEEYKDNGWAKNIKDVGNLWKTLANAQSLIGRKTIGIPDFENAKDEELSSYYEHTRPKNATDYVLDEKYTDEERKVLQDILFTNGLTKKQATNVVSAFQDLVNKDTEKDYGQDGLVKEMESRFGKDWEDKTKDVRSLLKSVLTQDEIDKINSGTLTNYGIGVMYDALNKVINKFGANEKDFGTQNVVQKSKMTYEDFYKKMQEANKQYNSSEIKSRLIKEFYGE